MHRIFLPPKELKSDEVVITGDNARHLSIVLRIQPGEQIFIFDGLGYRYNCIVRKVHKKEVAAEIINKEPYSVESPVAITLGQGIARGEKMDLIVQKSTELGVQRIIPVITERSQVRHTKKLERWKKIATSAAQQSGRDKVPEILEPVALSDFLNINNPPSSPFAKGGKNNSSYLDVKNIPKSHQMQNVSAIPHFKKGGPGGILKLILSESYKKQNLKDILKAEKDIKQIILLIGPEGGFSTEEVKAAVEKGFVEVSLGPRILRTETAPIAVISIIQYERGDMS